MAGIIPFLYLIPAAGIGILWLFARKESLPAGDREETKGLRGRFAGIGLFLYRRIPYFGRRGRRVRITADLGVLEPRVSSQDAEHLYYADKIGVAVMLIFAGSVLACLVSVSARQDHVVENGAIGRKDYGRGTRKETLVYRAADDDSFEKEITVSVTERRYTAEETDRLFAEAAEKLPSVIAGENTSLDEVRSDLKLVRTMEGYPFAVSWKIGNYSLLHSDGKLQTDHIPTEGAVLMLTARFSYLDRQWEQELPVHVFPPLYSQEELWEQGMQKLLQQADQATEHEAYMKLPQTIGGSDYIWSGKTRDDAGLLFLLILIAAAGVYVMKDRDLEKRVREREEELAGDYPQFVSKLTLYLGAGMTVRNVFGKLAGDYAGRRKRGGGSQYLYEELGRAVNEIESGVSEADAYEHFAFRCRSQQYIRLCTLLTQNLRKGNAELLRLLREESKKALDERMDRARKRGEEAGTKLLLPMMLMLVVVMVMIMVPAFLSI